MFDTAKIKQVLESSAGVELERYLVSKVLELKDIENIKEYTTSATQALEVKAQLRAYKKLKEIMEEILVFEAETRKKDERDSFEVY